MNEKGNEGNISAETVPLLSVVIDRDGRYWGPFDDAIKAAQWAGAKWPDQEQEEHSPLDRQWAGWDLAALWPPDSPQRKG